MLEMSRLCQNELKGCYNAHPLKVPLKHARFKSRDVYVYNTSAYKCMYVTCICIFIYTCNTVHMIAIVYA